MRALGFFRAALPWMVFCAGLTGAGCQSTAGGRDDDATAMQAFDEDGPAPPPAEAPPAAAAAEGDGKRIDLGQLDDNDLRQVIYEGLKARLGKTTTLGGGDSQATEIGDYDTFKFTVIKLSEGRDDLAGNGHETPDGMDVEVTGWYKRGVAAQNGEVKPACTSFDATVILTKKSGQWRVKDEGGPAFGREDSEDCF